MICHICLEVRDLADQQQATEGYLCSSHYARLFQLLLNLARQHDHLSDSETLARSRDSDTERWVGSKAPCDTRILSLTDWRTRRLTADDPVSVERVLRAWLYAAMEGKHGYDMHALPMPRFGGVRTLVADLLTFLPWMAEQPAIVRFARHVAALSSSMRPFAEV